MGDRTRDILARHVLGLASLCECETPRAAVIAREERILGTGVSRPLGAGKDFTSSAVMEAILDYIGTYKSPDLLKSNDSGVSIGSPVLLTTPFPILSDLASLIHTDVRSIYYMGDIEDKRAVKFLNSYSDNRISSDLGFEVIKIKI